MSLKGWKECLYQRYLIWLCRPSRMRRYLETRIPSPPVSPSFEQYPLRVAALQVKLELCNSPFVFMDLVHRRVKEAYEAGARLVVFPEYFNLLLFGMLPGIEDLEKDYDARITAKDQHRGEGQVEGISLREIFCLMTPVILPLIKTLFSALAVAYRLFIMAGSYTLETKGSVVNRAFLFNPKGELEGSQDKVHLLPVEKDWELKPGRNFAVFKTAAGRLAMPVCMDATYFETFRILEQLGAEIVLLPIANLETYNYWLALRGIWPRVQESLLFGVKSALVGRIAGLTFTGRAGIFAPLELTSNRDGVLAEVDHSDREGMAIADLDLKALQALRRNHSWRDSNSCLYDRYFPQIYRR